ncbi:MAG: sterol desaturase family protein [Pseudobdellovibrio sp.]
MLDISIEQILSMGRLNFFLLTVVYFVFLYFLFTLLAYYFFTNGKRYQLFQKKEFRPNQIQTEIKRSMLSILMFGLLSFPMYEGLKSSFLNIKFEFTWVTFIVESFALFLWNEVYFYVSHRTFHFKIFYKYHADHHYSHVPSPFSAYSFHWSEGIILGAVMPVIMCFHDFQFYSLMTLPIMSIVMNVLGHSNVDFNPDKPMNSLLSFSKRHSLHHKIPHSNYGFFLPYFDMIFKSDGEGK